nr:hypothetical protein [Micromonospora sp. DSM 115978]
MSQHPSTTPAIRLPSVHAALGLPDPIHGRPDPVGGHPGPARPAARASRPVRAALRGLPGAVVDFYRAPAAQLALIVTAIMLCFVGGAAMFWFHAVYLGEGGPAISQPAHWLLDSSFAFVGLTPALALILPLAGWAARSVGPGGRLVPWLYALVGGTAFAAVTTPGPLAHDALVGRGTWLADRATDLIGDPGATLAPTPDYPPLAAMTQQFGAGVPLYVGLMLLTVALLRRLLRPAGPQPGGFSPQPPAEPAR